VVAVLRCSLGDIIKLEIHSFFYNRANMQRFDSCRG
jgi:hypothetical protein